MECRNCGNTLSYQDRIDIELTSKTVYEIASDLGIEGVELGNVQYEIDEATMPTSLLPLIVQRAAQTALLLSPDKEFYFEVGEVKEPDVGFLSTHLYISVNPNSTMTIKEALPILSHTIKRFVELSRLDDPLNPFIKDLRIMSMSELAEGFSKTEKAS